MSASYTITNPPKFTDLELQALRYLSRVDGFAYDADLYEDGINMDTLPCLEGQFKDQLVIRVVGLIRVFGLGWQITPEGREALVVAEYARSQRSRDLASEPLDYPPCRWCGVAIETAELCGHCAKNNEPFAYHKYAEARGTA